jgi:hypothetical protein
VGISKNRLSIRTYASCSVIAGEIASLADKSFDNAVEFTTLEVERFSAISYSLFTLINQNRDRS